MSNAPAARSVSPTLGYRRPCSPIRDRIRAETSCPREFCEGRTNIDFAGLEIDSAGHWRQLNIDNGELVPARGFGHEGQSVLSAM
jgi:hypothetical protein